MEIIDQVESWDVRDYKPVKFQFLPPASTTPTDKIQIQFNVFGWMDPIEIWPVGDGTYEFQLFGPLNFSAPVDYRFCRSHMCGTMESETLKDQTLSFQATSSSQTLQIVGQEWSKWLPVSDPTVVTTETSQPKFSGFHTIVEFSDTFRPYMMAYFPGSFDSVSRSECQHRDPASTMDISIGKSSLVIPEPGTKSVARGYPFIHSTGKR